MSGPPVARRCDRCEQLHAAIESEGEVLCWPCWEQKRPITDPIGIRVRVKLMVRSLFGPEPVECTTNPGGNT